MAYHSSVGCDRRGDQPTGYATPSACFHTPEITITLPALVEEYSTIEQKINELTTQENALMQNMWSNVQIMSRINIPDMLKLENLVKEKRELFQHAHTIRLKIVEFAELNTTPLAVNQFRISAQQIARMWDAYEAGLYQTEKAFGLPLHSLVNLSHKYND
ncbi:hypothetical protein CKV38_004022 [Salmonella enterica subsp. enterica serovar Albany]|nr:hypothetical protein [Salmonella enterica subsp. enterica serovar Albany]